MPWWFTKWFINLSIRWNFELWKNSLQPVARRVAKIKIQISKTKIFHTQSAASVQKIRAVSRSAYCWIFSQSTIVNSTVNKLKISRKQYSIHPPTWYYSVVLWNCGAAECCDSLRFRPGHVSIRNGVVVADFRRPAVGRSKCSVGCRPHRLVLSEHRPPGFRGLRTSG